MSVRQLTALGIGKTSIEKAVASGRLHRIDRGVYAVGHSDLTLHGTCLAGVLAGGPGALLSHYSAAWLWRLLPTQPVPVHVTTPVPRRRRAPIRLHYARNLSDEDRRFEDGRNRGHHGAARLRRALDLYRPPRFTRSGLERAFLVLLDEAGLPEPVTAYVEAGYELDVYWPQLLFAVELDVFETHGTRESFEADRLRQEDLKLAGFEIIRLTGRRLEREPQQVMERVARRKLG